MNQEINNLPNITNPTLLWAGILVSVVAVILIAFWFIRVRRSGDDKKIEDIIKTHSDDYIKDAIISDGMYGYYFLDYLINVSGQVVLLGVQHYKGYIFGGDTIDVWAQVVNNKSYKFKNPLQSYIACTQMLNDKVKGVNAISRVVFTSESEFPKGIPDSVYPMHQFQQELEQLKSNSTIADSTTQIWQELKTMVEDNIAQYKKEQ